MKNIIFILFIGLLFSSSCCRFIPARCITNTTDTLTVVEYDTLPPVYKDTTIFVPIYIPGEITKDSVPYPVYIGKDGLVNSDTLFMNLSYSEAWAVVENSILKGELIQKDTLLQIQTLLKNAIKETTILRNQVTTITNEKTIIQKQATKIKSVFIGIIIILSIILAIKLMKR